MTEDEHDLAAQYAIIKILEIKYASSGVVYFFEPLDKINSKRPLIATDCTQEACVSWALNFEEVQEDLHKLKPMKARVTRRVRFLVTKVTRKSVQNDTRSSEIHDEFT